jgi:hypothetical protein
MDALFTWLLAPDLARDKLALLVLCMVVMYVTAAHLAWRARQRSGRKPTLFGGQSRVTRSIGHLLRALYYVGIPLIALWRGQLVQEVGIPSTWAAPTIPDWMYWLGLSTPEDLMRLGTGLALAGAALGVLIAVWIWYARMVLNDQELGQDSLWPVTWWEALREAFFLQMLWFLFRSFFATLTGNSLQSAFGSLALIALCWLLDPARRHDLFTARRAHLVVHDWLCALFTALISMTVQSLWLLILAHTIWTWASGKVLSHYTKALSAGRTDPHSRPTQAYEEAPR